MQKRNWFKKLGDKGYYLALGLCVVGIGAAGWLFSRSLAPKTAETVAPSSVEAQVSLEALEPDPQPVQAVIAREPTEPEAPKTLTVVWPVEGTTVQTYSMDKLAYNETTRDWRTHNGIDLAAPAGTAVVAAADGVVESVQNDDFLGKTVTVRHEGGYVTHYANLAPEVAVVAGQTVAAGDRLGTVGKTALLETAAPDHLHFAVYKNNVSVDPASFLPG